MQKVLVTMMALAVSSASAKAAVIDLIYPPSNGELRTDLPIGGSIVGISDVIVTVWKNGVVVFEDVDAEITFTGGGGGIFRLSPHELPPGTGYTISVWGKMIDPPQVWLREDAFNVTVVEPPGCGCQRDSACCDPAVSITAPSFGDSYGVPLVLILGNYDNLPTSEVIRVRVYNLAAPTVPVVDVIAAGGGGHWSAPAVLSPGVYKVTAVITNSNVSATVAEFTVTGPP